jgi:hypothetical protein
VEPFGRLVREIPRPCPDTELECNVDAKGGRRTKIEASKATYPRMGLATHCAFIPKKLKNIAVRRRPAVKYF